MGKKINLTGQKFERLTVISEAERDKYGAVMWLCRCECGTRKIIRGGHLLSGNTMSCGCLNKELLIKRSRKHGMASTPIYKTWKSMRQRCYNPNDMHYKDYGGRGITICERWDKFKNFYEDMGEKPNGLEIERMNNNQGYSPENCKWATPKENSRNKRNNRIIKYGGKSQCLAEWAEELGIERDTLWHRLDMHPPQLALNM